MRRKIKFIPLELFGQVGQEMIVQIQVPSSMYIENEKEGTKVKVSVKLSRRSTYFNLLLVEQYVDGGAVRIRAPNRRIYYYSKSTGLTRIDGDLVLAEEELSRFLIRKEDGDLRITVIGKEIEREPQKLK